MREEGLVGMIHDDVTVHDEHPTAELHPKGSQHGQSDLLHFTVPLHTATALSMVLEFYTEEILKLLQPELAS